MKWLIGIAIVMLLAHAYFRRGLRRLKPRGADGNNAGDDSPGTPPPREG